MASPSYTYTLTNGTTADAAQVMQDFNDILNGVTDGTKDLAISALTVNGAANLKAAVTLGASSANDLTINGSLATTLPIKTNTAVDVGSATLGLRALYLGGTSTFTGKVLTATLAASRVLTIPDPGAAANFVMSEGAATINGVKTFAGQLIGKGTATNDTAAAGYIGEELFSGLTFSSRTALLVANSGTYVNVGAITLTAGSWQVSAQLAVLASGGVTSSTLQIGSISTSSAADVHGTSNDAIAYGSGNGTNGECRTINQFTVGPNISVILPFVTYSVTVGNGSTVLLNLNGSATFTGAASSMGFYGSIRAVRTR